jgi:hypothetical protein
MADYELISAPWASKDYVNSITALKAVTGATIGGIKITQGYYAGSLKGGATYKKVDPTGLTANDMDIIEAGDGSFWQLQSNGSVDAYQFGALGNDTQTVVGYTRQVDNNQVTLTQQTRDGIAIDGALDYLESIGGGVLYLPKGIYRTRGYQRDLNFSVSIYGDGIDQTIIKITDDAPTNMHGFGIFCAYSDNLRNIHISKLTLDANGHVRAEAGGEFRSYPLALYGKNLKALISEVKSINSNIDCLYITCDNGNDGSVQIVVDNCHFEDAYRNVISIIYGDNIRFNNCTIKGGGTVHSGTSPKSCLDVEPNFSTKPVLNTVFTNCSFSKAFATLYTVVWSQVKFVGCYFDGGTENPNNIVADPQRPYLGQSSIAQVTNIGCTFIKEDNHNGAYRCTTDQKSGKFVETQFNKFQDCEFIGAGILGNGKRTIIENTSVENSLFPVIFGGEEDQEVYVDGLVMTNVLNTFNISASAAAFGINQTVEGPVSLNNINIKIDLDKFPTSNFSYTPSGTLRTYGIELYNHATTTKSFTATNIFVEGYYDDLCTFLGVAQNAGNFRDWALPILAPADSIENEIKKGRWYYKNCRMSYQDTKITKYLVSKRNDTGITTGEEIGGVLFQSNDADLLAGEETCASIVAVAESTFGSTDAKTGLSLRTRKTKATPPVERVYIDGEGIVTINNIKLFSSGTTAKRPAATKPIGLPYYNTTLARMEWWNGTAWVTSFGTKRVPKELNIGNWDMTSTFNVLVPHGLSATEWKTIKDVGVEIRNDDDTSYITPGPEITIVKDATNLDIQRVAADRFDSVDFDASSYNRGTIRFTYIPD